MMRFVNIKEGDNIIHCSVKKFCWNLFSLFFLSFIIFYFVETIFYQSFSSALAFVISTKHVGVNIINLCIIILFMLIILVLSNNIAICFGITAFITYILAVINELKMNARGEAFTFNDITVAREALLVAGNYDLRISVVDLTVFFLILCLFIFFMIFLPKGAKIKSRSEIIIRIVSAFICTTIFIMFWMNMEIVLEKFATDGKYIYVTAAYYSQNGYLAGIARTTPHKLEPPEGYSQETLEVLQNSITYEKNDKTPNVIFVMNESLYDIGMLDGIEFNKDPLEKMKNWQEKYTCGNFISPASGGGTCNVEFEVITGCPLSNVGGSAVLPYSDMIHHDMVSLISLMNSNGYRTVAFHPNIGSYFNRRQVYNYMKFNDVYFSEEMGQLPKEGLYSSDLELYKKVIEVYEDSKESESPFFSYIVTMQNHGGYSYEYDDCGIEIVEGEICENKEELKTYANIIASSIDAFEYLMTYFDDIEDPTVIVMFGDHIPALDVMGYKFSEVKNNEWYVYRLTPLIVYSNYNLPYEDWGYVNGYSLAAKVLDYCEIRTDDFLAYELEEDNVPTLENQCYINDQWMLRDSMDPEVLEYQNNLWLMSYDRVFGEAYGGWGSE